MKIIHKLILGFASILACILLMGYLAAQTYGGIHETVEELNEDIVPGAIAMVEMEGRVQQTAHGIMDYIMSGEKKDTMTGLAFLEEAGEKHLQHETHIGDEEKKTAQELVAKIDRFKSIVAEVINMKNQGASIDELLKKENEEVHPAMDELDRQLVAHKEIHLDELAAAEKKIHEAHKSGVRSIWIFTAIILLLSTIISVLISISIKKPLGNLVECAGKIKQGDLETECKAECEDELGDLARTFDEMRLGIKDRNDLLNSILKTFKGKFGNIATILVRKNVQELVNKNPRIEKILPKPLGTAMTKAKKAQREREQERTKSRK